MIEPDSQDWILCSDVECDTAIVRPYIELDHSEHYCRIHRKDQGAYEFSGKNRRYCSRCGRVMLREKGDPPFEDVVLCSRHKGVK